MKSRILFIDDESNILSGLRRMLRHMRGDWDMIFVDSGEKAIELMQDNSFDVFVSDMRMPGMDGATLLNEVRRRQPSAVRIILSGYAKEEAVLRTVGPAHQYLTKPCDAAVVIDTISRALSLRRFLNNGDLLELVSGLDHLPSPPEIYSRLLRQLGSSGSAVSDIADTIAEDLAMTAQTLKLTNSAYFALPQKVDNLHHAVSLLGTDTLKALVLVAGFYKQFAGEPRVASQIEKLSRRSLSISMAAHAIASEQRLPPNQVDQASSAGVLTHVGTLTLLANWPGRFDAAVKLVEEEGLNIVDAERQIFGAAHPEIGAYLLGLWGFTDPITEAVAYHHSPRQFLSKEKPSVLVCVYAAQHLLKTAEASQEDAADALAGADLDMDYLQDRGLGDSVPHWADLVRDLKSKTEEGIGQ
ncbi:MAG: HDOD domain-containing protein [Rhodospirillaceae bacterium]|nr:HDOD domain-containing protein [Rhodospirillaceae bacterium]MBT8002362.1 HDOD domain-containing protein [Rhodospirillales bacterium]